MTPDLALQDYTKMEFEARIARIRAGIGHTKSTIFVGQDEAYRYAPGRKSRARAKTSAIGNMLYPLSMLYSLAAGLAGGIGVRLARAWAAGEFEKDIFPTADMALNFCGALIIAWMLASLLRLRGREHVVLHAIGAAVMVVGFHNLVHWYPDLCLLAFPPDWTRALLRTTEPDSLLIWGVFLRM